MALAVGLAALLIACQGNLPLQERSALEATADDSPNLRFDADQAWGGEARCDAEACLLALAEHRSAHVSVYEVAADSVRRLQRQAVAYHPDSARWIDSHRVAAAVEASHSIDLFDWRDGRLLPHAQIDVGFAPRDLLPLPAPEGSYRVLATPYGGTDVALAEWNVDQPQAASVRRGSWCKAPWHPVRVGRAPGRQAAGIAVGCLDDHVVVWVPQEQLLSVPQVLAQFDTVPRRVAPSPSGRWLYVALENTGRNARIDMDSGAVQYIPAPTTGAVSVAPLRDDLAIWGDDQRLYLQQLDASGTVQETRWLPTSGFSTGLQLVDLNGDGALDLVVLDSAGERSDIIHGPLWERASATPIEVRRRQ